MIVSSEFLSSKRLTLTQLQNNILHQAPKFPTIFDEACISVIKYTYF